MRGMTEEGFLGERLEGGVGLLEGRERGSLSVSVDSPLNHP